MPPTRPTSATAPGEAWFAGVRVRGVTECVDLARDADRVAAGGFWVVVGDFDGPVRAWRFADVERDAGPVDTPAGPVAAWAGPPASDWRSSLDRDAYVAAVDRIRSEIQEGEVYQVNLCRVLAAPLAGDDGAEPDARALGARLAAGNPAPYAGGVHVPAGGDIPPVWVVTASPELFLRLDGGVLASGPIKGTAPTADGLTDKDRAENVMITDLVRNDLQRVCLPGTVEVVGLLSVEPHPGLVHLVSTVQGVLRPDVAAAPDAWSRVLGATYPPGSVSGAPKSSALRLIADLEPVARGPYCGAVGWIDADAGRAELAVGIRTFWWTPDGDEPSGAGTLRFGTGAGITWGSDPEAEWEETELKARRLVGLASRAAAAGAGD